MEYDVCEQIAGVITSIPAVWLLEKRCVSQRRYAESFNSVYQAGQSLAEAAQGSLELEQFWGLLHICKQFAVEREYSFGHSQS